MGGSDGDEGDGDGDDGDGCDGGNGGKGNGAGGGATGGVSGGGCSGAGGTPVIVRTIAATVNDPPRLWMSSTPWPGRNTVLSSLSPRHSSRSATGSLSGGVTNPPSD